MLSCIHESNGRHELYNHEKDPDEMRNLVSDVAMIGRIGTLREALINHQMESARIHGDTRHKVAYEPRQQMEADYRNGLSSG